MQEPPPQASFDGLHVAIIMDGNGRWATRRGRSRTFGHRRGERSVREVVEQACRLGLGTLTLYAFSSDNWDRPALEVSSLMSLLGHYLRSEPPRCCRHGVRINVIGRRDRLSPSLNRALRQAEAATAQCRRLHLRIAIDYSSRDAILRALPILKGRKDGDRDGFLKALNQAIHSDPPSPEVDLLIRTGGEQRLSDFMLWESAYAELIFTRCMWPDFRAHDLQEAVSRFHGRRRRFGRIA